ncbi:ribosome maturation factor [Sulfurimonas microaerophilic]|uniref:ribosome maturation factor n=1 Tax=Sulfurimonas microaerophilic TaxID=3058392 RepID=UPI0027155D18|nr:ribosome maturation factor [Sulfurimonas sp. hsl 1-7]
MSLQNDIESLVKSVGLELYDTSVVSEFGETIYRVAVISPEFEDGKRKGVTMDECVDLTHLISPLLDVTPPVSGEYRLEVGSPGLERKLTTLEHFAKSLNENIAFTTMENEKIKAKLVNVDGSKLTFENEDGTTELEFNDIRKAKTYFEWK